MKLCEFIETRRRRRLDHEVMSERWLLVTPERFREIYDLFHHGLDAHIGSVRALGMYLYPVHVELVCNWR